MNKAARTILGILLAAALLALVFHDVDHDKVGRALATARPEWLLAAVLVGLASYAVRAWQWGSVMAPLARARAADLLSATMIGFAAGLVVPRAGELVRPWLISRRYPVKLSAGLGVILVERLFDLVAVLVLFALYLFVLPRPTSHADTALTRALELGMVTVSGTAIVALVLLAFAHARRSDTAAWAGRLLSFLPARMARKAEHVVGGFVGGLAILGTSPRHVALVLVQSVGVWLLAALSLHCVQLALGIELPVHATFLLLAFLVVGESIPTPGLIGGFHAFYVLALSAVLGVDRSQSAIASVVAHGVLNLPVLLIGLACLGREGLALRSVLSVRRAEDAN